MPMNVKTVHAVARFALLIKLCFSYRSYERGNE